MIKYDLPDLGYKYKGISSVKSKTLSVGPWNIIDVPEDVDDNKAIEFVKNFITGVVAVELPTSLVCNLRCVYCYIDDPRMKNKHISPEQVTNMLENISQMFPGLSKDPKVRKSVSKNGNSDKVYLSPWGAEPFMNIPTLKAMQEFGHESYGKGHYTMSTSTNGTIWNEAAEKLFISLLEDEAFQSIQVSLDGPKELQDQARPIINGEGSFDKIGKFVNNLNDLSKNLEINRRLHTFCSTIHLLDDNFVDNWIKAAEFFSTPNTWHTALPALPMRMSGEDMFTKNEVEKFVEAQHKMSELVERRAKEGITVIDFYTYKIFGNTSAHSKNAFPFCSALNTQIGIDFDGSIYPCHGAITSPEMKPFLWVGNMLEKTISYKQLYRNFSYQYGTLWTRGRCATCPLFQYGSGNVCWSCPAHNLSITGEPSMDSILKCVAYEESFKYWIKIAKMTIDNPVLKDIPKAWYNDLEELPKYNNEKITAFDGKSHFDMNYDGMMASAVERFNLLDRDEGGKLKLTNNWWGFDNFFETSCKN